MYELLLVASERYGCAIDSVVAGIEVGGKSQAAAGLRWDIAGFDCILVTVPVCRVRVSLTDSLEISAQALTR
ncbi:hypothetical protein ACVXG8_12250 [Escherichia coli]